MTTAHKPELPKEIAGIRIPDSQLAVEATQLAWECSERVIFNHVIRTYVFAELAGQKLEMRPDSEILYVASVLHDLGLTARFAGPQRFEVDGADAARAFALERGVSAAKAALIWDAVAFHTTVGIAHRKEAEVALVHLGAGLDVVGSPGDPSKLDVSDFPKESLAEIVKTFPRLGTGAALADAIGKLLVQKPHTAYFNFASDIAKKYVPDFREPGFYEILEKGYFRD